jgi:hypothetical protein
MLCVNKVARSKRRQTVFAALQSGHFWTSLHLENWAQSGQNQTETLPMTWLRFDGPGSMKSGVKAIGHALHHNKGKKMPCHFAWLI